MMMVMASKVKRGLSRQFSIESMKKNGIYGFRRQNSLDPRPNNFRFTFGRQSSMDPMISGRPLEDDSSDALRVPENLDYTMQLLFMASKGDLTAVQDLLDEGIDVNSIDLDGRTALHIASCEGHLEVVKLLLRRKANIDARDRWGSTAAADAKYYGNIEVYEFLRSCGAKVPYLINFFRKPKIPQWLLQILVKFQSMSLIHRRFKFVEVMASQRDHIKLQNGMVQEFL